GIAMNRSSATSGARSLPLKGGGKGRSSSAPRLAPTRFASQIDLPLSGGGWTEPDRRAYRQGDASLPAEELLQRPCRGVGIFLRQIVAAVDRETAHVLRPVLPHLERVLALAWDAALAPDRQHRTGDLLLRLVVGLVEGEVGGVRGAVVLAGRVDTVRVLEERVVVRDRARVERREILALGARRGLGVPVADRVVADHRLREGVRQSEEGPVPDA